MFDVIDSGVFRYLADIFVSTNVMERGEIWLTK